MRTRLSLITALALAGTLPLAALAAQPTAPSASRSYHGPAAVMAANGSSVLAAGTEPAAEKLQFTVPRNTRRLGLSIRDQFAGTVSAYVVFYRHDLAVRDVVVCSATHVTLQVPAGATTVQALPVAGTCGVGASAVPSTPIQGVISLSYS